MATFGKAPSTAPTFGPSEGSLGSVGDNLSIHADAGGAFYSKNAVPCVSNDRLEGSSPAAIHDPSCTTGVHESSWAIAQAATVAAALGGVGAMAAADDGRALLPGGAELFQ